MRWLCQICHSPSDKGKTIISSKIRQIIQTVIRIGYNDILDECQWNKSLKVWK